tara:strand:- start:3244 stop:3459 length:216 start_codon:yes stop_codon:yes gene_type:complete
MINLDQRYHDYLHTNKSLNIDGVCEKVKAYGYTCNSNEITGYYVMTESKKLYYDLSEKFLRMERVKLESVK